jgi:hypothetical protein
MNPALLVATALIGTGALFLLIGLAFDRMSRCRPKPGSKREKANGADQVLIL